MAMRRKNEVIHSPLSLLFAALLPTSSFSLFSFIFPHPFFFFLKNLHCLWFGTVNNERAGISFILHGTYCSNHSTWTCSELDRQSEVFNIFSKFSAGVLPMQTVLGSVLSDFRYVVKGTGRPSCKVHTCRIDCWPVVLCGAGVNVGSAKVSIEGMQWPLVMSTA